MNENQPDEFSHVAFYRPSTESKLIVKAPHPIADNDGPPDDQIANWMIEEYPDWIPAFYCNTTERELNGSND